MYSNIQKLFAFGIFSSSFSPSNVNKAARTLLGTGGKVATAV